MWELLALGFPSGVLLLIVGIARVTWRAGVGYDGVRQAAQLSPAQRREKMNLVWAALLDHKHPLELRLIIVGLSLGVVGAVSASLLAK
jgi:hypothetical protein